jgi:hypothetical protein
VQIRPELSCSLPHLEMDIQLVSVLLTHETADRFFNAQRLAEIIIIIIIVVVVVVRVADGIAIAFAVIIIIIIIIISPSSYKLNDKSCFSNQRFLCKILYFLIFILISVTFTL